MNYRLALIAVKDVERSKQFYTEVLQQEVDLDLGWNVTFNGGFAIQQNFAWLVDIPPETVVEKSHNMELYFEVDDFDDLISKLKVYPQIEYVHPPKKHEWQQRVVRIYDPDHHIIEIGESMAVIAKRYLNEGYSVRETAEIIQHPETFVKMVQTAL